MRHLILFHSYKWLNGSSTCLIMKSFSSAMFVHFLSEESKYHLGFQCRNTLERCANPLVGGSKYLSLLQLSGWLCAMFEPMVRKLIAMVLCCFVMLCDHPSGTDGHWKSMRMQRFHPGEDEFYWLPENKAKHTPRVPFWSIFSHLEVRASASVTAHSCWRDPWIPSRRFWDRNLQQFTLVN